MKKLFGTVVLAVGMLLCSMPAMAQQVELGQEADSFAVRVTRMLQATKNEVAQGVGEDFNLNWTTGALTNAQKTKTMALAATMQQRNFRPKPQFENFFGLINGAINAPEINSAGLDSTLHMLDQALQSYDNGTVSRIMRQCRVFLQVRALQYTNYNRLYAYEGTFSFGFAVPDYGQDVVPFEDDTTNNGWGTFGSTVEEAEETEGGWDNGGWGEESNDNWDNNNSGFGNDSGFGNTDPAADEEFDPSILAQNQPTVVGAVVRFENVTLAMVSQHDSVLVRNTSGAWLLKDNIWVGQQGETDWSLAGLPAEDVKVVFDKYSFDVTKSSIKAENVNLTYRGRLNETIKGRYNYEIEPVSPDKKRTYPRFISYESNISINNLASNRLRYTGGFSLAGARFFSASVNATPATIQYSWPDGRRQWKAQAVQFSLVDSTFMSQHASIVLYHGSDSIYHPDVRLRYDDRGRSLTLLKHKSAFNENPYYSTYYKMDLYSDMLEWDLDSTAIEMNVLNARTQVPVLFVSKEFFSKKRFESVSNLYNFHPLVTAVGYARRINRNSENVAFYADDMAQAFKLNPKHVRASMKLLARHGFVEYQPNTGYVTMMPKAYHYVYSYNRRRDYDNLLIPSVAPKAGSNATINTENGTTEIRGIPKFYISRPLDVYIYPDSASIKLLNGRDFVFDGKLNVGNFEFVGQDFNFKYDSFLVRLNQIDSINFYVRTKDERGNVVRKKIDNHLVGGMNSAVGINENNDVQTDIQGSSGTIYINRPDNKSNRVNLPEYPIFDASRGATVYFNDPDIANGAYDRTVYFEIPPFAIDSLSNSDPSAIGFGGTFYSGGMLPEFQTSLRIVGDSSLGFTHTAPPGGYEMYGTQSRYYGDVKMDNEGLHGPGRVDHLTSTLNAEDWTFYKDSLITHTGTEGTVRRDEYAGTAYPDVSITNFDINWQAAQDKMRISNQKAEKEEDLFQMYSASATLNGTAVLTQLGLNGEGLLRTRGSESESQEYDFKQSGFTARHAAFQINSENPKKPILNGDDIKLNFDFAQSFAEISPEEEGTAAFGFPYAQVKTSITTATWLLDRDVVQMVKAPDTDISNSYFHTTNKAMDSVAFNATEADYDIARQELSISGIPSIRVADAFIIPDQNQVLVKENAEIQKLTNARIVLDTAGAYHTLINSEVDIVSRTRFDGFGTLQFVNASKDTFNIRLDRLRLEPIENARRNGPEQQTVSRGNVTEASRLLISPGMFFKGQVAMFATQQALNLEGAVKLDLKNIPGYDTWIAYTSSGAEQQEVQFDFKNSITEKGDPLVAGLHFEAGTNSLYSTFITDKRTINDPDFFVPDGLLSYEPNREEYVVEDTLKASGATFAGRMFAYNENTGDIRFEGPLNFIDPAAEPNIEILATGRGRGNLNSSNFNLTALMGIMVKIPAAATELMAEDMLEIIELQGAADANRDQTQLMYRLAEVIGDDRARAWDERSLEDYTPLVEASTALVKTLLISDIDFKWSEEYKAFYNEGQVGLSNIMRNDINARMDGFVEITKALEGDGVTLFLQLAPDCWYYFAYKENRLELFSSNSDFNAAIESKSNAMKAKPGELVFYQGDLPTTLSYVNRFRRLYYGITEPYNLEEQRVRDTNTDLLPQNMNGVPANTEEEDDGF